MGREHQSRKLFGKLFAPWAPPWLPVSNHVLSYLGPLSKCLLLVKVSHTLEFSSPAFLVNLELPYKSRFKRYFPLCKHRSLIRCLPNTSCVPGTVPKTEQWKAEAVSLPSQLTFQWKKHEEWHTNFNDFLKNVLCFPIVHLTLTQKSKSLSMSFCWLVFNGLPLNSIP